MELGGAARHFIVARSAEEVLAAASWTRERNLRLAMSGGGSNLLVADDGWPGVVMSVRVPGVEVAGGEWTIGAGEPWDPLVARTVDEGWTGLECLSGIPGWTGATPIQNVGAYGVETSDVLSGVEVVDLARGRKDWWTPNACRFGYRSSRFKAEPERFVVTRVKFALRRNAPPRIAYPELARALPEGADARGVREVVLSLRGKKGMVLDLHDAERRTAGSFFMNPVVDSDRAHTLLARHPDMPHWPTGDGVKLSAGWLIERSGLRKGQRWGAFGISSRHALALVHFGGGTTRQLLEVQQEIVDTVRTCLGVELHREPVLLA